MARSMGKWLAAATVSAVSLISATASVAVTLADALAQGYENSGLLEQNRAVLRAADEDVAQAVSALLPVVEWSAGIEASYPDSPIRDTVTAFAQINASLLLYDHGASEIAIEAQKEVVLATRQSLLDIEQQVLLRVVEAYMNVRRQSGFVQLRRSNVRLISEELRAAQDRFDVGEVTRTDVSLAEARLASARSQLAAAEGELARAQAEYVAAVGVRPDVLQPAGPFSVSHSTAQARAVALREHPSIREAQHSVSAAELSIRRAEAALQPRVTLNGNLRVNEDFDDSGSIGVTIGGPIYQGGALSSQIRQLMARRDQTRHGLLLTTQQVEQNVTVAYSFLEVARASREAFERQVRASSVAFEGVREEALLGARTTLDVLNAEQELLDARTNLISAQIDETIASYQVLASMGLLTAEHLNLRVQIYDPSAYYNLVRDAPTVTSDQGAALDRVLEALGEN